MNYILLDTSYLIFYRYFALLQWWKMAKADIELPSNPYESKEFVDKFVKTFLELISTIKKKLKIHKQPCKVIAARDCSRKNIWRNEIYSLYKESRYKDDEFMGGEFFKMVYENSNSILKQAGVDYVFNHDKLEGDDIIAITKKYLHNKHINKYLVNKESTQTHIYIIANDHDYLQFKISKFNR